MLEKIKSYIRSIDPKSPKFIAIVASVLLVTLLIGVLSVRSVEEPQIQNPQNLPTPIPTQYTTKGKIPGKDYVQGQILVKFNEGLTEVQINQYLVKYNAKIKSTITGINTAIVEVPPGDEDKVREALLKDGIVKYADPDRIINVRAAPNDTDFNNQWGFSNSGQNIKGQAGSAGKDVKAVPAWDKTRGQGIKVAILDTGLDESHPEFAGKVALKRAFSTATTDDAHGHGTHVAGMVSAVTNNGSGVAGSCPECQLIIGKVMDDSGNGPYSTIAQGMTWAADNGAKVVNMSLGGYSNDNTLNDATHYVWSKGSIVVAAAGNDSTSNKFYPAGIEGVVSVAATDNKDQKASFSNYGSWVKVAAPGKSIYSTLPTKNYYLKSLLGTALNYDYLDGTSMATPIVSGVVALIWSSPYGTSNQAVVDRLYATSDQISGTGSMWVKGRVNADAAVSGGNTNVTPTAGQPTVTTTPTITVVPTFVCGGSPNSICNPTITPSMTPNPTGNPNPTITQGPGATGTPIIAPTTTPTPDEECLDPRNTTPERINNWIKGFFQKINDYIRGIFGNPQNPPTPPQPCIIR